MGPKWAQCFTEWQFFSSSICELSTHLPVNAVAGIVQLLSFFLPLSLCHFDASPSLWLPTRHPIIFNFIYRDCQEKVFTNNIQVSPLIVTNEMESEMFWSKKISDNWKYRGTLYREGGDLFTALPSVSNYFVQMSPNVFPWLTPSHPKCWTEKCKVYRRTAPERTFWNLLTLSIFSPTAPGSMCPNWKPQLLKAINAMDFWGHCCFSAHFDFHWCRPLHHWWLINCKIVCGMNHEQNDMLTEVVTFQIDVFIE